MNYGKTIIDGEVRYIATPGDWLMCEIRIFEKGQWRSIENEHSLFMNVLNGKAISHEITELEVIVMCGKLCGAERRCYAHYGD